MSKPTKEELAELKNREGDDEKYHVLFDDLLEAKLHELDPEWLAAMKEAYAKSGMARWVS